MCLDCCCYRFIRHLRFVSTILYLNATWCNNFLDFLWVLYTVNLLLNSNPILIFVLKLILYWFRIFYILLLIKPEQALKLFFNIFFFNFHWLSLKQHQLILNIFLIILAFNLILILFNYNNIIKKLKFGNLLFFWLITFNKLF